MQYADKTRHLGGLSSWIVDLKITQHVETMSWPRFLDLLDATLLQVDEATYHQRADDAANHKDVRSYRGEHGLRTLIAKIEAGDALAFQALVDRVADCLADDPIGARRAKAVGIIAHQARLRDLLARHADQPHDPRHPEERVDAHLDDPSDPWAEDDLPPAGWETSRNSNYHQPSFDDLDDLEDSRASQTPGTDRFQDDQAEEAPINDADRAWHDQQRDDQQQRDDARENNAHDGEHRETPNPGKTPDTTTSPADSEPVLDAAPEPGHRTDEVGRGKPVRIGRAFRAEPAERGRRDSLPPTHRTPTHRTPEHGACHACGSTFDLQPMTPAELNAGRTRAIIHVHVSDHTLINQQGVLRTTDPSASEFIDHGAVLIILTRAG